MSLTNPVTDPSHDQTNPPGNRARWWTWVTGMAVLSLLGCLAVYNALYYYIPDPAGLVRKQLICLFLGIVFFLFARSIDFSLYRKASLPLLIFQMLLLAGVLFFGKKVNGMRGWYDLTLFYIQPSEIAKCTFLLYLCTWCAKHEKITPGNFLYLLAVSGSTIALILFQPDFGSAVIFFAVFVLCIFLKRVSLHYIVITSAGMLLSSTFFLLSNEYAMKRILTFLQPDGPFSENAWHIRQFQYTMAHGSWTGAQWGSALWSGAFLPLPHTDSVFASIVEGTGFLGGTIITLLFGGIALYFCRQSWKIRSAFEDRRMFVFCAGAITAIQGLLHISVNCILLPPTGITLPFLSYGGSSLLAQMLLFGIAASAIRKKDDEL